MAPLLPVDLVARFYLRVPVDPVDPVPHPPQDSPSVLFSRPHLWHLVVLALLALRSPLVPPSSLSSLGCPDALVLQSHLVLLAHHMVQGLQVLLSAPPVGPLVRVVQEHRRFQLLAGLSQMG